MIYTGPYIENAPDFIVGFNEGYRTSWDCANGIVAGEVFADNVKAWSGDHGIDPRLVPGIFFCNRKLDAADPSILDFAPTVLTLFGIRPPKHMEGKPLFGAEPAEARAEGGVSGSVDAAVLARRWPRCSSDRVAAAASAPERRVVVLGFDGLDYGLTRRLIDEGRLPNMARMERSGQFAPLETSVPPESPVAWSNFITGMDPGGHGIFDFVHRDPATMMPFASDSKAGEEGFTLKLGKWRFPLTGGGYESLRKGEPFWQALEEHGIESWVLRMPANYPTSGIATRELSGHGHARPQRRALLLVLHLRALLPHRGPDRRRRLRVGRLRRHGGAEALRPREPAARGEEATHRRLQGLRRARDPAPPSSRSRTRRSSC